MAEIVYGGGRKRVRSVTPVHVSTKNDVEGREGETGERKKKSVRKKVEVVSG